MGNTNYSRLIKWEVTNFMSIEHGECEFDDRNIINIKGYNDSGKSAMLRALDVLFGNISPQKQVEFIQDDKDYFRVIAYFDDGVAMLRDKYINGQSLYEMYKDGVVVYSTKVNNALTKVTEVPEPISTYLGLITYENTLLNSRSCFQKQLGVQTTGAENYKMFNTVLKSEEIASASTMLNNDKNKLIADINALDAEISANQNLVLLGDNLTQGMIDYLKLHDFNSDTEDKKLTDVNTMLALKAQLDALVITPELASIDMTQLDTLKTISELQNNIDSINIGPAIAEIESKQLNALLDIQNMLAILDGFEDYPEIHNLDTAQIEHLIMISNLVTNVTDCDTNITNIDTELKGIEQTLDSLMKEMQTLGVKMVKCPSCGKVFDADTNHVD